MKTESGKLIATVHVAKSDHAHRRAYVSRMHRDHEVTFQFPVVQIYHNKQTETLSTHICIAHAPRAPFAHDFLQSSITDVWHIRSLREHEIDIPAYGSVDDMRKALAWAKQSGSGVLDRLTYTTDGKLKFNHEYVL